MYGWCSKYWLWVEYALGAAMAVLMAVNWGQWSVPQQFCGSIVVFLALHVCEEWRLPGGFHYQYNLGMGSDAPNAYPLNMLSDMVTNLGATILYFVLAFFPVNDGLVMMAIFFGFAESAIHTFYGVSMRKRFGGAGKRTIYSPGSATAYLYFAITAVLGSVYLSGQALGAMDWATLGILVVVTVGGFIAAPEKIFRREDTPFAYPDAGYFEKFVG